MSLFLCGVCLVYSFPAVPYLHELDVFMTTSARPGGEFYLQQALDGYARQVMPRATEIHVYAKDWFGTLDTLDVSDRVYLHLVNVTDPYDWRDDEVTASNRGHAVDAHGRMQTYTVLAGLMDLQVRSTARYLLLTEDDWVPCPDALGQILHDISNLPTRMASYRCAYGLGCLVVERFTVDAFAYWAALNGFVTPIDSLSSIFYTREDTSAALHKFGLGSSVYDGNSELQSDALPYVKRHLPTVHVGAVSTFRSEHHISYAHEFSCGDIFDSHSPVVRDGVAVEAVVPECFSSRFSPCSTETVERLTRLLSQ